MEGITTERDQEILIDNHLVNTGAPSPGSSGRYLSLKLLVLFIYLFSLVFNFYPTIKILLIMLAALFEFWHVKNKDGLELAGMRWSHEIGDGGDPRWVFYSRPDPYVPNAACLRVFWAGVYIGCVLWSAIAVWGVASANWFNALLALVVAAAQFVNLACFLRCNKESTRQADDVARLVMLGDAFDSDNLEPEDDVEADAEANTNTNAENEDKEMATTENSSNENGDDKTHGGRRRALDNPRLVLPIRNTAKQQPAIEISQNDE